MDTIVNPKLFRRLVFLTKYKYKLDDIKSPTLDQSWDFQYIAGCLDGMYETIEYYLSLEDVTRLRALVNQDIDNEIQEQEKGAV